MVQSRAPAEAASPDECNRIVVPAAEQCELCSAPIPAEHRHLLELTERRLVCACGACATLFPGRGAGNQQFRLVPDGVRRTTAIEISDAMWASLAIPVDLAFFFFDTAAGHMVALYPSAVGVTESRLSLADWEDVARACPSFAHLEPDVEALLVNRTREAREEWLVPIDVCYRLAGVIRRHWKGLGGGEEVWQQLGLFFDDLRRRARTIPQHHLTENAT
ncbi:MAG TPA: DUF5947 family protein [Gemmatimonadaceae bacterium]|jgi:hypothetical protein